MAGALFRTKSIDQASWRTSPQTGEATLKRTLGPWSLVALGIGAIIGAGLFVRTAAAIAERSGPSVTLAFLVAGLGCAFAGLCYAEFASMIPIAGSAYTYSYATMGELVAWIIGWDLMPRVRGRRRDRRDRLERVLQQGARVRRHARAVPVVATRRSRRWPDGVHGHHEHPGDRSSCWSCRCCSSAARRSRPSSTASSSSPRSRSC